MAVATEPARRWLPFTHASAFIPGMAMTQPSEAAPSSHVPRPTVGFMLAHPARPIALGFGSGLSPVAPGTAGSLFGWVTYVLWLQRLSPMHVGWLIAVSLVVGWWACTRTAEDMRVLDPGNIVWDEIVAIWIVLWLVMPAGFLGQLIAFALFRLFDALKPGPVGWADRLFHGFGWRGGLGIMLDDLVAAFCTLLVIAAWRLW
jgi:phosphatidylglycerophosphatase A